MIVTAKYRRPQLTNNIQYRNISTQIYTNNNHEEPLRNTSKVWLNKALVLSYILRNVNVGTAAFGSVSGPDNAIFVVHDPRLVRIP